MTVSALTTETSKLKAYFNSLSGFARFFFPRQLKQALQNDATLDIDVIFAAFNSTWFFHRLFFPTGLNAFFTSNAIRSAQWLCDPKTSKHTQQDMNKLRSLPEPNALASILCALNPRGGNNEKAKRNFQAICEHRTPEGVTLALLLLNQQDEFNTDNAQKSFNTVITGLSTASADHIIALLKTVDLLTHANLLALLSRYESGQKLGWTEATLTLLNDLKLLSNPEAQANFNAVIQHNSPYTLWNALDNLQKAGLLTETLAQTHVNELLEHHNPEAQARRIITRHQSPQPCPNPPPLNAVLPMEDRAPEPAPIVTESLENPGFYQQCSRLLYSFMPSYLHTPLNSPSGDIGSELEYVEIELGHLSENESINIELNDSNLDEHELDQELTDDRDREYDEMELGRSNLDEMSSTDGDESIGSELDDSDWDWDEDELNQEPTRDHETMITPFDITAGILGVSLLIQLMTMMRAIQVHTPPRVTNQPGTFFGEETRPSSDNAPDQTQELTPDSPR